MNVGSWHGRAREAGAGGTDAVLPATRWLAAAIVPFLVVAFVVLYPWPGDTDRWFAWTIKPTMTPMVLGATYLGGAWYFVQVWRATRWHAVRAGFIPVTLFASAMGVATVLHWSRFHHHHVAFWIWVALYATTPFLVLAAFLANERVAADPDPDELMLPAGARVAAALTGVAAVVLGAFLYLFPRRAIDVWPWALTPLTARVVGGILALGAAGVLIAADGRWSAARLMLQVARTMIVLFLVAGVRVHDQLDASRALTWLLAIGLSGVLVAATVLDVRMQRRASPPR